MSDHPHSMAMALAATMRILLETPEDKLQCLAYLVSATVSDDGEAETFEEFRDRVEACSHNVVLDFSGEIDRHSAAWRARVAGEARDTDPMQRVFDCLPSDGSPVLRGAISTKTGLDENDVVAALKELEDRGLATWCPPLMFQWRRRTEQQARPMAPAAAGAFSHDAVATTTRNK